jgi:hypothetical protein
MSYYPWIGKRSILSVIHKQLVAWVFSHYLGQTIRDSAIDLVDRNLALDKPSSQIIFSSSDLLIDLLGQEQTPSTPQLA